MTVSAAKAFAAIADPTTYDDWLVGARAIDRVEPDWPARGSRFHHRVGIGPFQIPDYSEVLAIDPGRMLKLRVKARPLLVAVATFHVVGDDERCVVTLQEEPAGGWVGALVGPVIDPAVHVRNHRSLRNLARWLGDRSP